MTGACVFCQIIAGELPASVVYRDDATLAFMDVRQPSAAHVLVVPLRHVATIFELDGETAARLMQTAVLAARAVQASLKPAGINLWQSNGDAAGQEVPHVHLHVLARSVADGLLRIYPQRPRQPDRRTLDELAAAIRAGLDTLAPIAPPAASPLPVDPEPYRQRMAAIVRATQQRWAGDVSAPDAEDPRRLLGPVYELLGSGEGAPTAIAVLEAVTSEYMAAWHDLEAWTADEDGFLAAAARVWTDVLLAPAFTLEERQAWRPKLAVWHEAVEDFGPDGPFGAPLAATGFDGAELTGESVQRAEDAEVLAGALYRRGHVQIALEIAASGLDLPGDVEGLAKFLLLAARDAGRSDLAERASNFLEEEYPEGD